MENATIGIKIADGSYVPILEEGNSKRKRLVLTTVNDNQESVQIDLYKGKGNDLLDAVYIGSLLIESIVPGPKESSEIELKIGFDQNGNLNAEAGDLVSGQFESLSISMETLGEASMYDVPEFSLDDSPDELIIDKDDELNFNDLELDSEELTLNDEDFDFPDEEDSEEEFEDILDNDLAEISLDSEDPEELFEDNEDIPDSDQETDNYTSGLLSESKLVHKKERKSTNPILIALLVLISIAAIGGISYLIFRSLHGENSPILEAASGNKSVSSESTEKLVPVVETAVPAVAVSENNTEAKVEGTAAVPKSISEEQQLDETPTASGNSVQENLRVEDTTGVWYKIRWGDTLWGISYSFYDTPGSYNRIVKENRIKNPDIIFAETEIFIPSK
ncbi:MAG: Hsp70 family protein [Spirochaetaceae bacterium]|nr:Hsp70 family protein [Spirochaetaceae bacterium]